MKILYFDTKKDATLFFKSLLKSTPVNQAIGEPYHQYLLDLIIMHHRWADEKIGRGVSYFTAKYNKYGNKEFWIVRNDGTKTDVSYTECINTPADWHKADIKQACRRAIANDIIKFKKDIFRSSDIIICPITGALLEWENSHVDHWEPQFDSIVESWLNFPCWLSYYTTKDIKIKGYEDGEIEKRFEDKEIEDDFISYHRRCARLRLISTKANLQRKRKET